MSFKKSSVVKAAVIATTGLVLTASGVSPVFAQAIITNGTVKLGVDRAGQLNVPGGVASVGGTTLVGVRYLKPGTGQELEYTSDGSPAEGWGVSFNGTTAGYANRNEGGAIGLTVDSFGSTASTATSVVHTALSAGGQVSVTQAYAPSLSNNLYQTTVTLTNSGSATITDLRYRRVMDWDIDPTKFNESVTIQGYPAANLLHSGDYGFNSANPLSANASILASDADQNFGFNGYRDQGATFDFGFGSLAAGESKTFYIYYGGANSAFDALTSLNAVGAEVYSLAQPNRPTTDPLYSVSIFGFKGVGGTIVPNAAPEPGAIVTGLSMVGITGLGLVRGRRRSKKTVA